MCKHKPSAIAFRPNDILRRLKSMAILVLCVCFCWNGAIAKEPVQLIFDTDIGNDVDDVLALGVIHSLQSRGECNLLAVTITKDHPTAAAFVDCINTFYGRGDIPIGVCRNSGVTADEGKFNQLANVKDGGQFRYPHDLLSGKDAPSAVSVLRKQLAEAKDQSVVIAQVGFSTNLADLLDSKADEHSKLSGKELFEQKVALVSLMAGAFEKIRNQDGQVYAHGEYNIQQDVASCQSLVERCKVPMVWSGFEIGISLTYPHESIEQDYAYVEHHPLAEAYYAYEPPPHDRPTWDLTSVLYAVRPDRGYFNVSENGTVAVADNSLTTFVNDPDGRHRYLKLTEEQKIRTREALVQLSSEPARCK